MRGTSIAIAVGAAALTVAASAPAHAKPDPTTAAIGKVIEAQWKSFDYMAEVPSGLYAPGATFAYTGQTSYTEPGHLPAEDMQGAVSGAPGGVDAFAIKDLKVGVAADGNAAWASYGMRAHVIFDNNAGETAFSYRVTELFAKTSSGWQIVGGAWSVGQSNAKVNAAAQAGKLGALEPVADADSGSKSVREAFGALLAQGLDADAAARKELISIGSAPGEKTTTGKALAGPWKAAWVGKGTVDGAVRSEMTSSGTTACVTANVKLVKTKGKATYTIPFRVFAVFDKGAAGWSLVAVHFAVPPPP